MSNIRSMLLALIILGSSLFFLASQAREYSNGREYSKLYDVRTVTNFKGKIIKIEVLKDRAQPFNGLHLQLKTDQEQISVHLGPAWFHEKQNLNLKEGDIIEIKGSRVTFENRPAILAAVILKGDKTVVLCDKNGIPVWSGKRKRAPATQE